MILKCKAMQFNNKKASNEKATENKHLTIYPTFYNFF